MIDASDKILAAVIDRLEVRRSLRGAAEVLVLTEEERAQIIGIEPGASIGMITNGLRNVPATPLGERGGDVVFMARLHPRKRPDAFVRMAADVVQRGYESTQFVLAGPDEGMLEVVQSEIARLGVQRNVRWIGAVDPSRTDQLLANAAVYVLPSVGEVFPMSVLEAFRAGTPTVVTDSLGIAEMCIAYGAAIVTDGSEASLADAVAELLSVPARVEALRVGSKALLDGELGIDRVAARLVEAYGG
jgi:glycosyltransferase involved in cell wall biosynthesis